MKAYTDRRTDNVTFGSTHITYTPHIAYIRFLYLPTQGAFYVLSIGISFSCILLLIEKFLHWHRMKKVPAFGSDASDPNDMAERAPLNNSGVNSPDSFHSPSPVGTPLSISKNKILFMPLLLIPIPAPYFLPDWTPQRR